MLKEIRWENYANKLGVPIILAYFYSMFVHPAIEGMWSWKHIHAVWENWQTLNSAFIAFAASLIALNINRVQEDKQRRRNFIAAKAFLPEAFSKLSRYLKSSSEFLKTSWSMGSVDLAIPQADGSYREVFRECIRYAPPIVGAYLTSILVKLQVHEARLEDVPSLRGRASDKQALLAYMYQVAVLKVLLDKQFDFARSEGLFDTTPETWDDFKNAYLALKLHPENYEINEKLTLKSMTVDFLEKFSQVERAQDFDQS